MLLRIGVLAGIVGALLLLPSAAQGELPPDLYACFISAATGDLDEDYLDDSCEVDTPLAGIRDADGDGVIDGMEVAVGTDPLVAGPYLEPGDLDGDGCQNIDEVTGATGGLRHPENYWDFFDLDGTGDIDITDVLINLQFFGAPADDPAYQVHDRAWALGAFAFARPAEPGFLVEGDDGADLGDTLNVLFQFGHGGCAAPGPPPP